MSIIIEVIIQTTRAVPRYSQDAGVCDLACFCTLLGLCYSTLQSLKGTQKEKYSINTLYNETEEYTKFRSPWKPII